MSTIESEVARKHRQLLGSAGLGAYCLLDCVEPAAAAAGWIGSYRRARLIIIESLTSQEISVGDSELNSVARIGKLPPADAESALQCLGVLLTKSKPSRRLGRVILRDFGSWIDRAGPQRLRLFLKCLTQAPELLSIAGVVVVDQILDDTKSMGNSQFESYLKLVAGYSCCPPKTISALQRFARRAIECEGERHIDELVALLPPESTLNDSDRDNFMIGLGTISDIYFRGRGKSSCSKVMELVIGVGRQSLSTGYYVARSLARPKRSLGLEFHESYLSGVRQVISAVGVGAAGFALRELPVLYDKNGQEKTEVFIKYACEIAELSGARAAMAFLERRTEIARTILPK